MPQQPRPDWRVWGRRLAWMAALWVGGVAATGAVALALKAIMRTVGLSS